MDMDAPLTKTVGECFTFLIFQLDKAEAERAQRNLLKSLKNGGS